MRKQAGPSNADCSAVGSSFRFGQADKFSQNPTNGLTDITRRCQVGLKEMIQNAKLSRKIVDEHKDGTAAQNGLSPAT